jgi:hypothetical protein
MAHRSLGLNLICALAVAAALACSSGQEASPPAAPVEAGAAVAAEDSAAPTTESLPTDAQFDAPPPDVKDTAKVRCLVDSPPGCDGCDKGDTCEYEELTRYDCVYVVYGTDCSKAAPATQ